MEGRGGPNWRNSDPQKRTGRLEIGVLYEPEVGQRAM